MPYFFSLKVNEKLELHACKSKSQTLKVHAKLFKKGYWTKEHIYYYYC